MSFEFRDGVRADVPLLILLAGGTGAGKTESAMRLATGLADGQSFAVIDTERGRALHKADDYRFKHSDLDEPFSPERYAEAVKAADDYLESLGIPRGNRVIVLDSGSHEWEGIGGVLDLQAEEFKRLGERDSARMSSWIAPKHRHKTFVQQLLRARAHVILCLRAEDKIEIVKEGGKTVVRPKQSLTGADGWIPICEKRLPFEATISLLVTADQPGVPKPIKLESRHASLVPLDQPISEETGRRLAEWARGADKSGSASAASPSSGAEPEAERRSSASPGAEVAAVPETSAPPTDEPSFAGPPNDDPIVLAANEAREVLIPAGTNKGKKLHELLEAGPDGEKWMRYALRNWSDDTFGKACWAFSRVYMPDVYETILTEKEAAVA